METEKLTRKDCARLLGISISSFKRRCGSGMYPAGTLDDTQKNFAGQAMRFWSREEIGIQEPDAIDLDELAPIVHHAPVTVAEQYEEPLPDVPEVPVHGAVAPNRPLTQIETDLEFASRYKARQVADSYGNFYLDPNPHSIVDLCFGSTFFEAQVPQQIRIRDTYGDRQRAMEKRRNRTLKSGYGISREELNNALERK